MVEGAEPVHRHLIISRQNKPFDMIARRLYGVWIRHKAGKAIPIFLEKLDERKKVRIGLGESFRTERLSVATSVHTVA